MAPAKPNPDKLDDDRRDGNFLGVVWKSREYVVGTAEEIIKCSTIKTRPIDNVYDLACIDYVTTSYEDFILQGAKSEWGKSGLRRMLRLLQPIHPYWPGEVVNGRPDACI